MRTRRQGNRELDFAFWAGLLALLGGLVWLAVVLVTEGVDRANAWAGVFGPAVALTGALVALVTWQLRQHAAAGEPRLDQVARAAQELQLVVQEQWRQEAEARSLGDPDPMPVRWRLSDPVVMDHDEHIASATPLRFAGRSDRILALTDQFRHLRRRRLVITGLPGAGKTTLAVQLLLHLLEGWQPGEPVPVLFSLASWDPQSQPRVQNWLASQLAQSYPDLRAFGPDMAQKLADQGRLLPVLDGLDEIPPERRGEVIDRLNASLHPDTGLIVTSRITEYTDTVRRYDVLTAAAVIEPEPLTAREAARYLEDLLPRQADDSWQAVITALRDGTAAALAEVVASPLGLWLVRVVHIEGRRDPQPLINRGYYPDAAAIWNHLLDELIPAVIRSRPPVPSGQDPLRPKRRHDPAHVRRWLTTLAIELRHDKTPDWRWWHLNAHTFTPREIRLVLQLIFGLIGLGVVLAGLVGGLGIVLACLVGGLPVLLVGLGAMRIEDRKAPAHADLRLRGRIKVLGSKMAAGLIAGLVCGGFVGFGDAVVVKLTSFRLDWVGSFLRNPLGLQQVRGGVQGAIGGVQEAIGHVRDQLSQLMGAPGVLWRTAFAVGLVVGPLNGLIRLAASPSVAQRASSPGESLRGDRLLTVLATSMFGLATGLGVGLTSGLGPGLATGLMVGLTIGPTVTNTCWPGFVMATLWLAVRGLLPLSPMAFLGDAHRLGLLRIVGPMYQFRHAALQDHLAPPTKSTSMAVAADPLKPR